MACLWKQARRRKEWRQEQRKSNTSSTTSVSSAEDAESSASAEGQQETDVNDSLQDCEQEQKEPVDSNNSKIPSNNDKLEDLNAQQQTHENDQQTQSHSNKGSASPELDAATGTTALAATDDVRKLASKFDDLQLPENLHAVS